MFVQYSPKTFTKVVGRNIIQKSKKKLCRLFRFPIRVFVFHQVSDEFDVNAMWLCDWTSTNRFKEKIREYQKAGYLFISLEDASKHLKRDMFRRKKYAVLTADDGWDSVRNIIPWLAQERIPITLFVNPQYMDGRHVQIRDQECFLTVKDINAIVQHNYPLVTIASHGWSHEDTYPMNKEQFENSILSAEEFLRSIQSKIPYYAFPFGHYRREQIEYLHKINLVPVLVDGEENYFDNKVVHRECIDG